MSKTIRVLSAVLAALIMGVAGGCGPADTQHRPVSEAGYSNLREFGIVNDPWHVDEWADAIGAAPTLLMGFEHWHRQRTLDRHFEEARRQGLTSFMVTWEPWKPVPADEDGDALRAEQPEFSNKAIAEGRQDSYIREFAESVATSRLIVYIRHAHEMNGDWYPWSGDPDEYVEAWRHIVEIFRDVGASNARFVFSPNPSLYQDDEQWRNAAEPYWPGDDYVDLLGPTMISFGGEKAYSVAEMADRISLMHEIFQKDVLVSELNTAYEGRVKWLTDLRTWLATDAPWVVGVVLSQAESRGQVQLGVGIGDMSWQVTTDPATQPVIRGIIEDIAG